MKTSHATTMKPAHAIILAALTLVLAACSSAPKPGNMTTINPIIVPDGLTARESAAAIVHSIINIIPEGKPIGKARVETWAAMVDGMLDARAWAQHSKFKASTGSTTIVKQGWYVESISNNIVTLGFKNRAHYMSVRFQPDGDKLLPQILTSENLNQKGDNIHPGALQYLSNISVEIRKSLGFVSVLKTQILEQK